MYLHYFIDTELAQNIYLTVINLNAFFDSLRKKKICPQTDIC